MHGKVVHSIHRLTRLLLTPLCDCGEKFLITLLHVSSKQGKVYSCPSCGSTSPRGLVWRFLTGKDATASVLATSMYQEIPPQKILQQIENEHEIEPVDVWSKPARESQLKINESISNEIGGQQLLIFSDSRQDAAFFAPYLNRTYSNILRRRLILEVLNDEVDRVINNRWSTIDLINPLRRAADRIGLFTGLSNQLKEAEAWKWILHELLAMDRRNSLEGLGLLGFSFVQPDDWSPLKGFLDIGLSEDETRILYQVLL